MAQTILIKYDTIGFSRKIPETRKIAFNFLSAPNVAPKPTDQSHSNSISRAPLQLSPASFFSFST